jgi:cobalt/nickel transport system permease protein
MGSSAPYVPPQERDGFLDRNIIAFLRTLSVLAGRKGGKSGRRAVFHPSILLAATFIFVLFVSLSRSYAFLAVAATLVLVELSLLDARDLAGALGKGFLSALFSVLILLPAALSGNFRGSLLIAAKILISVLAVASLSATGWHALTRSLAAFRIPDLFILILDISFRYIWSLGFLALDMLYALKLRSVGRNDRQAASLAGVAGTLFLKSREASEELYAAMECRCFSGSYRIKTRIKARSADFALIAALVAIVVAFFLLAGAGR